MNDASPYKGLNWFTESDQGDLAGRERDLDEIISRLAARRALALYGRSGLGKTSVLQAGVLPILRQRGWITIYVRTLHDSVSDLFAAVNRSLPSTEQISVAPESTPDQIVEALVNSLRNVAPDQTILLAFDQFEEVLIRRDEALRKSLESKLNLAERRREHAAVLDQHHRFSRVVIGLLRAELDIRALFSVREDYLAALDDYQREFPDLLASAWRLLPLNAHAAREAIVRPLIRRQVRYSERLVSRLVDELALFDFDTARLQLVCHQLYLKATTTTTPGGEAVELDERHFNSLDASGSAVDAVFRSFLRDAVHEIASIANRRTLCQLALSGLLTSDRTKNAMMAEEVLQETLGVESSLRREFFAVLVELKRVGVLRVPSEKTQPGDEENGSGWYELAHDRLGPEIRAWLDGDDDMARFLHARRELQERSAIWSRGSHRHRDRFSAQDFDRLRLHKHLLRPCLEELRFLAYSAVYCGDADAAYWAERLAQLSGRDLSNSKPPFTQALGEALCSPDFEVCIAALRVLPDFLSTPERSALVPADERTQLFDRCWELLRSLSNDLACTVGRAAMHALDATRYIERLGGEIRVRQPSTTFRALVGTEDTKAWKSRSRMQRWLAQRWRDQRSFEAHRTEIESGAVERRLMVGVAILFGLLGQFVLVGCLFGYLPNPLHYSGWAPLHSGFREDEIANLWLVALAVGIVGSILGFRFSFLAVRDSPAGNRNMGRVLVDRSIWITTLVVAILGFIISSLPEALPVAWKEVIGASWELVATGVVGLAMLFIGSLWLVRRVLAGIVQVGWELARCRSTRWHAISSIFIWSAMLGTVLPIICSQLATRFIFRDTESVQLLWLITCLASITSLIYFPSVGIAIGTWRQNERSDSRNSEWLVRIYRAGLLSSLAWLLWTYGVDSLLPWGDRLSSIRSNWRVPQWPDTLHLRVPSKSAAVKVPLSEKLSIRVDGARPDKETSSEDEFHLDGDRSISITPNYGLRPSTEARIRFLPVLNAPVQPAEEARFFRIVLRQVNGTFQARLQGQLPTTNGIVEWDKLHFTFNSRVGYRYFTPGTSNAQSAWILKRGFISFNDTDGATVEFGIGDEVGGASERPVVDVSVRRISGQWKMDLFARVTNAGPTLPDGAFIVARVVGQRSTSSALLREASDLERRDFGNPARLNSARELIEMALDRSPNSRTALTEMAWILFRLGSNDLAHAFASRATNAPKSEDDEFLGASSRTWGVLAHTAYATKNFVLATNAWVKAEDRLLDSPLSEFSILPLPPDFYAASGSAKIPDRWTGTSDNNLQHALIAAAIYRHSGTNRSRLTADELKNVAWTLVKGRHYEAAYPMALDAWKKSAQAGRSPDNTIADTYAHAAFGTGRFQEAVEAWEKAGVSSTDPFCAKDRELLEEARRRVSSGSQTSPATTPSP